MEKPNLEGKNPSQRAMIGARMVTTGSQGSHGAGTVTIKMAAHAVGVGWHSVQHAKLILRHGTAEEIKAVDEGRMGVGMTGRAIAQGVSAADRIKISGDPSKLTSTKRTNRGHPGVQSRAERQRIKTQIWNQLSGGLEALATLPAVEDVIQIASHPSWSPIVDRHLDTAIKWLEEFRNAR